MLKIVVICGNLRLKHPKYKAFKNAIYIWCLRIVCVFIYITLIYSILDYL